MHTFLINVISKGELAEPHHHSHPTMGNITNVHPKGMEE